MKTLRRKIRQENRFVAEPGLPQMGPRHYLQYLPELHATLQPKVYFEIGTESGASLSFARCTAIAVDPEFRIETAALAGKTEMHLFQQPSDDFFASDALARLGHRIDLAFLDGMHLVEFLLRDFINTERHMAPGGVITLHDCVPFSRAAAERIWDKARTASWTGDVWKIVPILKAHRPDLEVEVLPLQPSGLVIVRNLDPESTVLADRYDDIVEDYVDRDLDGFGVDTFADLCGLPRPHPAPGIVINTSTPDAEAQASWGDRHFGMALAEALRRRGRTADLRNRDEWSAEAAPGEISLLLRGHGTLCVTPPARSAIWLIYPGKPPVSDEELAAAHRVFVASRPMADVYAERFGTQTVRYLPQAFDAKRMHPPEIAAPRRGVVFVGNNHFAAGKLRPIVEMAIGAGADLRLWGQKWGRTRAAPHLQDDVLPNDRLGDAYRGAEVVLCDHTRAMGRNGYVSNRIFDALACGAPVICDRIKGLPEDLAPYVHQVATVEEFAAALAEIRAEDADRRAARRAFAIDMARSHSFDVRAETLSKELTV